MSGELSDLERYRQHSIDYNECLWKMAVAIGLVRADESEVILQPNEVRDTVIKRLVHLEALSATRAEHIELLQEQLDDQNNALALARTSSRTSSESATKYSSRTRRSESMLVAAVSALRAVRSDRPSAHTDSVWEAVNGVIVEIESYQADFPPTAAPE